MMIKVEKNISKLKDPGELFIDRSFQGSLRQSQIDTSPDLSDQILSQPFSSINSQTLSLLPTSIDSLSSSILTKIFLMLPIHSLINAGRVNKAWNRAYHNSCKSYFQKYKNELVEEFSPHWKQLSNVGERLQFFASQEKHCKCQSENSCKSKIFNIT